MAAREAAYQLDLTKRMREAEQAILARAPEHDLEPDLSRISAVMDLLGDPQRTFPVIHITGTNGKTTTARIAEALLRATGLNVGRFTSPHLHTMRERISIGGAPISVEAFLEAYDEVLPFVELVDARSTAEGGPRMTYFEVIVAIGYVAFADAPVDVAVVEVGMGGGWDATNVADGQVAVITPISMDHAHFLGDTLEAIAGEKVGIIKEDALVVVGVQEPEVLPLSSSAPSKLVRELPSRATISASSPARLRWAGNRSACAASPVTIPISSSTCMAPTKRTMRRSR